METNKPSIFVSSTIYDFRDLRSALRHYLTELGYEVRLSELNDFPKPLEPSAIEAALEAVRSSDFYILLVGSRVGAYYDEGEGISITRQEYRTAYELAKQNQMRVALFVREEILALRKDRDALRKHLAESHRIENELSPEEIEELVNHSSSIANDAERIFDFLAELGREQEVAEALKGNGNLPVANWVHSFSRFEDIVDVLRVQLNLSSSLSMIAERANLRRELLENLILLTTKHENHIAPNYRWAAGARDHIQGDMKARSPIPGKYLNWAVLYCVLRTSAERLTTKFIDHALQSGVFLEFNKERSEFESSWFTERLFQLSQRIHGFQISSVKLNDFTTNFVQRYLDISRASQEVQVPNEDLVFPLALADLEHDIVVLSIALMRAIDGDSRWLPTITLNPPNPFLPEAEQMQEETPTLSEIDDWVREQAPTAEQMEEWVRKHALLE